MTSPVGDSRTAGRDALEGYSSRCHVTAFAGRIVSLLIVACGCLAADVAIVAPAEAEVSSVALAADTPHATGASADGLQIVDVRIGLAGHFKLGRWTPWTATLTGTRTQSLSGTNLHVVLIAPDSEGVPVRYRATQTHRQADKLVVSGLFQLGRRDGDLRVRAEQDGSELAETQLHHGRHVPEPLDSGQQLVVHIGPSIGLRQAIETFPLTTRRRIVLVDASDSPLPQTWLGYQAVDLIWLAGVSREIQDQPAVRRALRSWVWQGGTIVLSGVESWSDLAESDPFAKLLPGPLLPITVLRQSTALETFAGASRPLLSAAALTPSGGLPAVGPRSLQGRVLVREGIGSDRQPIITQAVHGLGRVFFAGIDLDRPPLQDWPDRPRLVAALMRKSLRYSADHAVEPVEAAQRYANLGYVDLAGQLYRALEQYPQVRVVPFWAIAGLLLVYILLIGPVDYLLLRRWRRPTATWWTFPLIAAAFVLLPAWINRVYKGGQSETNQVELIDVDTVSGTVRGTLWSHVYIPRTEQIDLGLRRRQETPLRGEYLIWDGVRGDGFGGMDSRSVARLFDKPYQVHVPVPLRAAADSRKPTGDARADHGATTLIGSVPLLVRSSRAFVGQWWSENGPFDEAMASELQETSDRRLRGGVANPLPVTLLDAHLLYGRWVVALGTVPSGHRVRLDGRTYRDVQAWLTQRSVQQGRSIVTPWNRSATEVPRIMQMIMFHDAAGGRLYTALEHGPDRQLDMSDFLRMQRAILVGRSSSSTTTVEPESPQVGEQWTFYRLVLRVRSSD